MNYTTEQFNKLPKWAQSEIKRLEMRLNESDTELERIKANTKSNTYIENFGNEPHYLKNDERVTFELSKGQIVVCVKNDTVDVHGVYGGAEMFLKPNVSNGISVVLK